MTQTSAPQIQIGDLAFAKRGYRLLALEIKLETGGALTRCEAAELRALRKLVRLA